MINGRKVIAIIPARSGSKSIPSKNIANCGGKPLIAWTIEAANASKYIDQTVVTTDSLEISSVALKSGRVACVSRPPELATDEATMDGVVVHALQAFPGYDIAVLLQPTSPLRTAADIDAALELLESGIGGPMGLNGPVELEKVDGRADLRAVVTLGYTLNNSVVSVHESHAVPFDGTDPPRRQDRKPMLVLNGAIYVMRISWFFETRKFVAAESVPYVMPAERAVDVDYKLDLALAGLIIASTSTDAPAKP